MNELPIELLIHICNYLNDKDKFSFFFTCKFFRDCSKYVCLKNLYFYHKVKNLISNFKFKTIYYKSIDENIPFGITYLDFLNSFNKPINNCIPNTILKLVFGSTFNQNVDGCLPNSIKFLIFGRDFNQVINKNTLPDSLIDLTFGDNFNQKINENILPNTLKSLTFGEKFNQSIKYLPDSLINLTFNNHYNEEIQGKILPGIKCLTFHKSFKGHIPNSVFHLIINDIDENKKKYIPKNVTHLTFSIVFNKPILNCIPNSITHLTFGNYFDQSIMDCIPNSVTHLTFGYYFNQSITDCIPNSVTHLTFGNKFNQSLGKMNNYILQFNPCLYPINSCYDCDFDSNSDNIHSQYTIQKSEPYKSFLPLSLTHLTLTKSLYEKNIYFIDPKIKITFL
ncbi:FNIP repeat-containing protein [Acanthamoeba polyphaga moumouvirus]|uniref:FNIP repeat-containing protein n=1 Tax=Acanthamoeba polyphaga moumouvirus TaxID=1269028 RepID=L7RDB1_9VIRU|nr:FNIP repeat-containing protein [Acanthamoeba polyphaga moumouvirus]AGC02347.1 FNIP repeat-containing protein [Acanthamoeba polyphaga moumouvirus]